MKNKLEVGMYCYNKTNRKLGIGKIISFQSNNNINVRYKNDIELVSIGNIKASFDIIDLIKEGDYVNGHQIYEIDRECCRITLNGGDYGDEFRLTYLRPALGKNMGIKSIVTKEQMEQISYRIGDKE